MKKSLKKVLAVILSAVMLVSCSAVSVFAQGVNPVQVIKTVKDVVDFGKSVKNVADQAKELPGVPKKVLDVGVSAIKFEKAQSDLGKALLENGITAITYLPQKGIAYIKLGKAVNDAKKDTGSSSVKFVIALVQQPFSVLKNQISVGKLGSAVTSGVVTNLVNDVKLGVNGVKVANSAKDVVTPSLSDLYQDILLPIRTGTAIKNIVEIAKGDDDDNDKPLTGTPLITDHGEEVETTVEETTTSTEEEEAPAVTQTVSRAVVAHTDGPMD